MLRYVFRRLGFLILTMLLTSMIIFAITQVLPGRIGRVVLGREVSDEAVDRWEADHGLNQPVPARYVRWLTDFVQGNWGESFSQQNAEIRPLVVGRLTRSMWLAVLAAVMAIPPAIALGAVAGLNANKPLDGVISVTTLALTGLPEFVTGIVLINFVALRWHWFPASALGMPADADFFTALQYMILPAFTATLVLLAYIIRLTRAGVIEVLKRAYIRTAVLKGLPWRQVVASHVLRNALLPTVTVIAISFGWLISGLVVIENVFGYPGLGSLMTFAVSRRDLPLMQAIAMVTVTFFVLANLLADLLYAYLNPRIRLE